jgi:exonuclease 3'-5' domain-containing protein 1
MAANVFASRPMNAKTVQYCANDVIHLPDLHALYLKRIQGNWLVRAKQESERRVAEAHSPGYEPQSPTKKLGPWGSGTRRRVVTLDEMLNK